MRSQSCEGAHGAHSSIHTDLRDSDTCSGTQHLPSKCTRRIICEKWCLTEPSTSFESLSPFFSCNGFLFKMHIVLLWINTVTAVFTRFPFLNLDGWLAAPSLCTPLYLSPTQPRPFPSFSYPCTGGNPGQPHGTHKKSNFANLNTDVGNAPLLPVLFRQEHLPWKQKDSKFPCGLWNGHCGSQWDGQNQEGLGREWKSPSALLSAPAL